MEPGARAAILGPQSQFGTGNASIIEIRCLPNQYLGGSNGPGTAYTNNTNITWTTVGGRNVQLGARLNF